jgi:hypothetical protein
LYKALYNKLYFVLLNSFTKSKLDIKNLLAINYISSI